MGCGASAVENAKGVNKEETPPPPAYNWDLDARGDIKYPATSKDIKPGMPIETSMLVDMTTSMNWPIAEGSSITRNDVLKEALLSFVSLLAAADSEGKTEDHGGGVMVTGFAGGRAIPVGDMNPNNFQKQLTKFASLSGTHIMPGWRHVRELFREEYKNRASLHKILVITDGGALDNKEFVQTLSGEPSYVHVAVIIIGYGADTDLATSQYSAIAESNPRVHVSPMSSETDPHAIAKRLLTM